MPNINRQWKEAQAALVDAATHLNDVWEDVNSDGDCDDWARQYPKSLTGTFPEFVTDLVAWRDATGIMEDQNPGSPDRPKGRRSPREVINSVRKGHATPVMGRAPIVVIGELKEALRVALRAVDLAALDLGAALPHRPNAGKPDAWLNYAIAVIEQDERNSDDTAVEPLPAPTGGDTSITIKKVKDEAMFAFWASVASRFPTAVGGDLGPFQNLKLEQEAETAIEQWVVNNVDAPSPTNEQ